MHDLYLVAMAHNSLKTQGKQIKFTQFQAECITMFGSQMKELKIKTAVNSVSLSGASKEKMTHSQKKGNSKDTKIQAQTVLIEKQRHEIEKN